MSWSPGQSMRVSFTRSSGKSPCLMNSLCTWGAACQVLAPEKVEIGLGVDGRDQPVSSAFPERERQRQVLVGTRHEKSRRRLLNPVARGIDPGRGAAGTDRQEIWSAFPVDSEPDALPEAFPPAQPGLEDEDWLWVARGDPPGGQVPHLRPGVALAVAVKQAVRRESLPQGEPHRVPRPQVELLVYLNHGVACPNTESEPPELTPGSQATSQLGEDRAPGRDLDPVCRGEVRSHEARLADPSARPQANRLHRTLAGRQLLADRDPRLAADQADALRCLLDPQVGRRARRPRSEPV